MLVFTMEHRYKLYTMKVEAENVWEAYTKMGVVPAVWQVVGVEAK